MFVCAFFAAGCSSGGSGGDFVASPGGANNGANGGGNVGAGSVTFNFVKAQTAPITVPTSTTRLRFEFFTGPQGTGTIVKREVRDFAASVTIENVPTSVRSTKVTALTAAGFPISQFTANLNVLANADVAVNSTDGTSQPITVNGLTSAPEQVDLGNSDTFQLSIQANFSNGEVITLDPNGGFVTFVSNNPAVVTVNAATGLLTAGLDGSTTVTATFTAAGFPNTTLDIPVSVGSGVQEEPEVVSISIVTPAVNSLTMARGSQTELPLVVEATFDDGRTAEVTRTQGLTFGSNKEPEITVNANQQIVIANDAAVGVTGRVTASFKGKTDFIDVAVSAATLTSISVTPATISLPYGGFTSTLAVSGTFSDESVASIPLSNITFSPGSFSRFTLNTSTGLLTTLAQSNPPAAGTENITVAHSTISVPSVQVPVTVGAVTVTELNVTPNPLTGDAALVPGEIQSFIVSAVLSDGRVIDVSRFPSLNVVAIQDSTTPDNNIQVSATAEGGTQVVAIAPTGSGSASVTFTLRGADTGGADFTATVNVDVEAEVINLAEGLTYDFAGIDVVDFTQNDGANGLNAVNLPRGYVGVIEVNATFSSGVTRRLRPSEYEILLGPEAEFDNTGAAIKLWSTPHGSIPAGDFYTTISPPRADRLDGPTGPDSDVFDDLYYNPRTIVNLESVFPAQRGTTASGDRVLSPGSQGTVVTRPTFRG